ncbi:MAG: hypothetical protein NC406_08315 [Bacteroides sp.]|nr:hypothetical protein [Bacteroides sp.]
MGEQRFYSMSFSFLFKGENYASITCVKDTKLLKCSNISPNFGLFGSPKLEGYSFVISIEDYYQPSYKLVKLYINGKHTDYTYCDSDWTVTIPRCFISNCDDMIVMPIKVVRANGLIKHLRYHMLSQNHRFYGGINNADLHTAQILSILISSMLYQFSDDYPWRNRDDMKALWESYTVYRYHKSESEYNNMLR